MKRYRLAIVFGRFQIFHIGHKALVDRAFEVAEKVIIFIGSANLSRTIDNPFTFEERRELVKYNLPTEVCGRIKIKPLCDYIYDDPRWKKQIDDAVALEGIPVTDICIVGGSKNEWYMDLFPEYSREIPERVGNINATDLRRTYFTHPDRTGHGTIRPWITEETHDFLRDFSYMWFEYVREEYNEIDRRQREYGKGPHLCCDNVIVRDNKVLLVKRKNHPGKDLWALPGGFLNYGESFKQGSYRELQEEATTTILWEDFCKYHAGSKVYDHPRRSVAAHIVTSVAVIHLPKEIEYKHTAADDASDTREFLLSEVAGMKKQMYDDHWDIISDLAGFGE